VGEVVYDRLDRARTFDPFSAEPDVLGAVVAGQRGDIARQRTLLERAIKRNPYDWFPYLELGLIEARARHEQSGLAWIAKASARNPHDATIQYAAEQVRAGKPPNAAQMLRLYVESAATCCKP
jgi:hypothetical protein